VLKVVPQDEVESFLVEFRKATHCFENEVIWGISHRRVESSRTRFDELCVQPEPAIVASSRVGNATASNPEEVEPVLRRGRDGRESSPSDGEHLRHHVIYICRRDPPRDVPGDVSIVALKEARELCCCVLGS